MFFKMASVLEFLARHPRTNACPQQKHTGIHRHVYGFPHVLGTARTYFAYFCPNVNT